MVLKLRWELPSEMYLTGRSVLRWHTGAKAHTKTLRHKQKLHGTKQKLHDTNKNSRAQKKTLTAHAKSPRTNKNCHGPSKNSTAQNKNSHGGNHASRQSYQKWIFQWWGLTQPLAIWRKLNSTSRMIQKFQIPSQSQWQRYLNGRLNVCQYSGMVYGAKTLAVERWKKFKSQ